MLRDLVQLAHLQPQALGIGEPDDLEEGDGHCEDHEHVDHLHVSSGGKAVGNSDVAGINPRFIVTFESTLYPAKSTIY